MSWVREWPLDEQWYERDLDGRDERAEDRAVEAGGTDGVAFYERWAGPAAYPLLDVLVELFEQKDAA